MRSQRYRVSRQGKSPRVGYVVLLEGENTQDIAMYAFLAVNDDRLDAFLRAVETAEDGFDPAEYGTVLASGPGSPTQYLVRQVMRDYDVAMPEGV